MLGVVPSVNGVGLLEDILNLVHLVIVHVIVKVGHDVSRSPRDQSKIPESTIHHANLPS